MWKKNFRTQKIVTVSLTCFPTLKNFAGTNQLVCTHEFWTNYLNRFSPYETLLSKVKAISVEGMILVVHEFSETGEKLDSHCVVKFELFQNLARHFYRACEVNSTTQEPMEIEIIDLEC